MLDVPFSTAVDEDTARGILDAVVERVSPPLEKQEALLEPIQVEGPLELTGGTVMYRLVGRAHANRLAEVRKAMIAGLRVELAARKLLYEGGMIVQRVS